jgi:hypothetical protein
MIGSITTKTRPLRLAFLIDPNNPSQVRDAIRLASSLWGGASFPIVPLYKRMPSTWADPVKAPAAKSVILGYLGAFDPDVLVQLSKEVPEFVRAAGRTIVPGTSIWQSLGGQRSRAPQYGIGIFEILGDIFEKYFRYKAKYPVKVVLPRIPRSLALFWASVLGELPVELVPILDAGFRESLEIEDVDVEPSRIRDWMARDILFPRRIVQGRLSPMRRSSFRREGRVFFMDASKVEDVVDFWNLRALGHDTIAVPKQLQTEPAIKDYVAGFLTSHRAPWPNQPDVYDTATFVRSRNSTMEDMQQFAGTLKDSLPAIIDPRHSFYSLQHWYPRIWDEWGRDKDGAVPDDFYSDEEEYKIGDAMTSRAAIKLALPDFAEEYGNHDAPRCANEVSIRAYGSPEYIAEALPKAAGQQVLRDVGGPGSFFHDWRINHNGLVRLVNHESTEYLAVPLAENVIFAWLSDMGWKPLLSAPGLLAKQIARQLDGNIVGLRNEVLLGLLEHMNGGNVQRDGRPAKKPFVQPELERDLEIGEVKNRLSASGGWYDYFVEKGIFRVGIRARCPHCLRNSWFPLQGMSEHLTCPRCLQEFQAVNNLTLGKWTYKTSGPFSVPAYAEGAYAVLLSVDFFCGQSLGTLRTTPLLSFKAEAPQKTALEADFALLWEESVYGEERDGMIFGECKTYGEFEKKDYDRMRYLAKAFPGAVLVFSTLRKSLKPGEIRQISRIARAGRAYWKADRPLNPVLILTGTELLSLHKPPYCWNEDQKKRFDHLAGLLGVCNATQQIYLGLPSWEAEWQEAFEKRRQKLLAKSEHEDKLRHRDS